MNHPAQTWTCDECGKVFGSLEELEEHFCVEEDEDDNEDIKEDDE